MFPEDRLDERTPAYLEGYYGAEADHEDGAAPSAMLMSARLKLQHDGLPYVERQRLQGRVAYCRSAVGSGQDR
jgi:hypothetical protein